MKIKNTCKECKFYRDTSRHGYCFGQKNTPYVNPNDSCENFIKPTNITIICDKVDKEQIIKTLSISDECCFAYSNIKCIPGIRCVDCIRKNINWKCNNLKNLKGNTNNG